MSHHLLHLLQTYGTGGLFVWLMMEYFFIPVPGETTLVSVGILWQSHTIHIPLIWLVLSTTLGTFAGSLLGYLIGRTLGRPFLERFGRYVFLTPQRIDKADHLFVRYTIPTLVFSRFIAGVRIIIPYVAGINKVPFGLYASVMLVSSLLWTSTFILAGNVIDRAWSRFIGHWHAELVPAILIVIALIIGYLYLHRWMHHKVNGQPPAKKPDKDQTP